MPKLQKEIHAYLEERRWHRVHPGNVSKSITIEAAELLEVFQWGNPTLDEVKKDAEKMSKIRKELADVIIYSFHMAVLLDLDLETVVREKLEKVKQKYPAELFKDLDPLQQGTHDIYWKIKKEHRQKSE